jgi:hypothetical protein
MTFVRAAVSRICRPHCEASFLWRFTSIGCAGVVEFVIERKDDAKNGGITDLPWAQKMIGHRLRNTTETYTRDRLGATVKPLR